MPTLVFQTTIGALVSSLGAPLIASVADTDHVSIGDAQWSLTIALLAGTVSAPVMGRLADGRFRREAVIVAFAVVLIGCVLAAATDVFGILLLGRAMQGVGLGLTPAAIATARDVLTPERARPAMALLSVSAVGGVGLGYPLTGLIAEFGGLAAAYWFGAGVALLALVVAIAVIPSGRHRAAARLDVLGAVLLAVGLAGLLLAISDGEQWGWGSPAVIGCFVLSALGMLAWVLWQRRAREPLIALGMLRHPSVLTADACALITGVGMYLLIALSVRYVQTPVEGGGLGASLAVTGLMLLPFSVGSLLSIRLASAFIRRGRVIVLIPSGAFAMICAMLLFAFARDELWQVFVTTFLGGVAVGVIFAAMPVLITRSIDVQQTGSAMSLNQVLRAVGYSTGSALSVAVLAGHTVPGRLYPEGEGFTVGALIAVGVWLTAGVTALVLGRRIPRSS